MGRGWIIYVVLDSTESLKRRDWEEMDIYLRDYMYVRSGRPHLIVYTTLARLGTFIEVGSNSVRCIIF